MTDALAFPAWPRAFAEPTYFRCGTCTGIWRAPVATEIARPVCTGAQHGQRHGMTHMAQLDADQAEATADLDVAA